MPESIKAETTIMSGWMINCVDGRFFGDYLRLISSTNVIVTESVLKHIRNRHGSDWQIIIRNLEQTTRKPDIVIEDNNSKSTLVFIRKLKKLNQNVIIKLHISEQRMESQIM